MNAEQSMVRAYIRRMQQVAALATEMQDIERKYELRFGKPLKDQLVVEGTRHLVEKAAAAAQVARGEAAVQGSIPTGRVALADHAADCAGGLYSEDHKATCPYAQSLPKRGAS